jgi:hypothetical protein
MYDISSQRMSHPETDPEILTRKDLYHLKESKYQGQPGIYTQFAGSATREEVARMAEGCRALQGMGERRCNLMYTIYKQAKKLGLSAKYLYQRQ